jgi:carboxymethylenebutenolidase
LLDLFDRYVHGDIDRRDFLESAKKFAAGGVTATAIWESLRPNYAWAQQVPKDDSRIKTEYVTVPSPQGNGNIRGYLVRPANASGKLPGVLVIHENRGLNPYIEDVARRLGTEKFIAFAPDGLTSVGGYPGNDEKGGQLFSQVDKPKMTEDFLAAAHWLKSRPDCTGKIGVVGFCFGGGIANTLAVQMGSDLAAAVPFYGAQPPAADTAKIKAPLLLHYAGLDTRIDAGWPAYEEALKANHVTYTAYVYEGVNHGFHNDTTPRYDQAAAKLAWQRTVEFFDKYLKG